ncbi:EAL domain-containing protein [Kangiella koreensis]|uniref:cyclic-guanylate-specific phosphodiesterase n=1 Tax=Kangiella koreensis (strain DSM 16069 / JCM 12317 / KCTC 12182 / SW-125) TaxID=523791 RepID=C7R6X9_KANKD|nr:EAL domain-containing protein [Kangiella koreensis]ACV27435.1 diguanylate cyclase/phosphodiesterase with PAS/PAC sensor(s) [Kangiella koreensis DSM 16069]
MAYKIGISATFVILLTLAMVWNFQGSSSDNARDVRVGLYQNSPKIYRNSQGQPDGLFIKLIEAIAEEESWQLSYVDCEWSECLNLLSNNAIDLMPDVAITDERAHRFDFHSIAVTHSWSEVWVRKDLKILGLPDLQGMRIAVLRESVQEVALQKMMMGYGLGFKPVPVNTYTEGFQAVKAGKADAVITNVQFADIHGTQFDLRETPVMLNPARLFYATAAGLNHDLLKAIDKHIETWRTEPDSVYYEALKSTMVPVQQPRLPKLWKWALIIGLGMIVLMLCINGILRWQVRKRTRLLVETNVRFNHLLKASPVVLYQLKQDGVGYKPVWVSKNVKRLFGYEPEQLYSHDWWIGVLYEEDRQKTLDQFKEIFITGHMVHEYRVRDAEGNTRYIRDERQLIPQSNHSENEIVGTWSDLTDVYEREDELKFLSHYDPLTHLPNRQKLEERIEESIERSDELKECFAILSIDIDRFKKINETLSYQVGDAVIARIAERLKHILNVDDVLARVGGDDFVFVINDKVDVKKVSSIARKVLKRFAVPLRIDEHELMVTASIGIAMFPEDGRDPDTLLKNAEIARYSAKDKGRNSFEFFNDQLSEGMHENLMLESALRMAVERNELVLHYQPLVSFNDFTVVGVEALIRWQHPIQGLIPPYKFIPLAEETGIIGDIGLWVLREACRQMVEWDKAGLNVARASVNISVQQIETGLLPKQVESVLKETGLAAERLYLELTESTIMQDPQQASLAMTEFQKMGVKLAVDDFGTGYSSMAYLKRLPLDRLKIDRSFIKDIGADTNDEVICKAIVQLAKSLGLETVAEGVEEESQAEFLKGLGCDVAQGYLYSKPVPALELTASWKKK